MLVNNFYKFVTLLTKMSERLNQRMTKLSSKTTNPSFHRKLLFPSIFDVQYFVFSKQPQKYSTRRIRQLMHSKDFKSSYVCNISFPVASVKIMLCSRLTKCFTIDSDVFWLESRIACYYNHRVPCGSNKVPRCYKILPENNIDGSRLFF